MQEVYVELFALHWEDYRIVIRCAFIHVPIGDGKGVVKEFTPRCEEVLRKPVEDIFSLVHMSEFVSLPRHYMPGLTLKMTGSLRFSVVS